MALLDDDGAELNLRSFNARSRDEPLFAYLVEGERDGLSRFRLTGRSSSFHVEATHLGDCDDAVIQSLGLPQGSGHVLGRRVYLLRRTGRLSDDGPRYLVQASDHQSANSPGESKASHASHQLLPGVALLRANQQELDDALDVFLLDGDPRVVTALPESDSRDFLLTAPVIDTGRTKNSWLDPRWSRIRDRLFEHLRDGLPDLSDWPPLLRLCWAGAGHGLLEFIAEGGFVGIHPWDLKARSLTLQINDDSPASLYRQWLLFDSPVMRDTCGWKNSVVRDDRNRFFSDLRRDFSWDHVYRDTGPSKPLGVAGLGRGFRGRLYTPRPRRDDSLSAWLKWLEGMPLGERRGGYPEVIAVLSLLRDCAVSQDGQGDAGPICELLADNTCIGDAKGGVSFFGHDQFLMELADRLMKPALCQLANLWFAKEACSLRPCVYALFSIFLDAGKSKHATVDWLARSSWTRQHVVLALGAGNFDELPGTETTTIVLPADESAAALARVLLPRRRIASRGFTLNRSRLNHPCHTL